jgi:citrate lyase beta subunit
VALRAVAPGGRRERARPRRNRRPLRRDPRPGGLRDAATRARLLGCDGKWALHPDQIEVLNGVFSPGADELARAQAVQDALQGASDDGRGVTAFAGEMIDEATRKSAEDLLARGRAAGLID